MQKTMHKQIRTEGVAMATKAAREETSERKRVSIKKADVSSLDWWDAQQEPSTSIVALIHAEIERSGYVDVAFKRVEQLPRRGRPPGSGAALSEDDNPEQPSAPAPVAMRPVVAATVPPDNAEPPARVAQPSQSPDLLDSIMGG